MKEEIKYLNFSRKYLTSSKERYLNLLLTLKITGGKGNKVPFPFVTREMVEKEFQKHTYLLLLEKLYMLFRHFLVLWPPWIQRKPGENRSPSSSQTLSKYYALWVPLVVQEQRL